MLKSRRVLIGPPHSATKFSINRRPEFIKTRQLDKPKPLPYLLNHFGQPQPWSINQESWDAKLKQAEAGASQAIARKDDSNGIWQHADSLNITAEAEQRAIRYAQWSMVAESAILITQPIPPGANVRAEA